MNEPKKFWVSGISTITFTMLVRANSVEEAKAQIKEKSTVDLDWDSEEIEVTDAGEIPGHG